MKKLNGILRIESKLLIVFYPQTDEQTKRVNQELEQYSRVFLDYKQEQWPKWLGTVEFVYNNKIHSSTKTSPFKTNYRQDPRIGFKRKKKRKYERTEKFIEKMKVI